MHVNIPVTEEVQDSLGNRYVLYSVFLEGTLLFKVRYSDLHLWDEQLQRVFGNNLPAFPPKYYLAMTKSMAEERRLQLEKYLQKLVSDPVISSSEIFTNFFKRLQLETFKIPTIEIILKVYLPNDEQIRVDVLTTDTAERVLELALFKAALSRELMEYFSLFITHRENDGGITVVKQIAGFELPFITIWNMDDDSFQIDIRKCYMNPSTDAMLMGCTTAIHLLYIQAVQEYRMNWSRPTEEQQAKLQQLLESENKVKFLQLMQNVERYGHIQLGACTSDYPKPETSVTVSIGYLEMYCCFHTSNGNKEILQLPITDLNCWHVQMCNSVKDNCSIDKKHQLEFMFEYIQAETKKCITLRTEQAFLLSTCLKKIMIEQPVTGTKEDLEIQVERRALTKFNTKCAQKELHMKKSPFSPKTSENLVFDEFTDIHL
ncbi:sorting nexin-31 [Pelobates cultripes]|uniref:Sorting nexin-31 n=1 Tax=Pelobates cultripes TaxID=61616 RepID=A0AAD1S240_PELCU|nr:sorting nexin-31 [Pelobates cultripes]